MIVTEHLRLNTNFLLPKIDSCEYLWNRPIKSVLHLSRGYSKAILNQSQEEQEIVMRTRAESCYHLEVTSAQFEVGANNTIEYFESFGRFKGAYPMSLLQDGYWF